MDSEKFPRVEVNLNAFQVVLNDRDTDDTKLFNFILEAKSLIAERKIETDSHVNRNDNCMTHHLSHKACRSNESECWSNSFPNWMLELNESDTSTDNLTLLVGLCPIGDIPLDSLTIF